MFPVDVPDDANGLLIRFSYEPGEFAGIRNLLTLSLFDPYRFRGAAHRWALAQTIVVDGSSATPGFLPGPIPPGLWRVELDAHEIVSDGEEAGWCDFHLTVEALHDPSASEASKSLGQALPGPAARPSDGARWYRGDLHSHSLHSDGKDTIAQMAAAAAAIGLDFRAATDHNTISQWRAPEPWPTSPLQIRGIECTTYFGHVNVLGPSDWIDWRIESPASAELITDQVAAQGAFAVVNHPCDRGNPVCTGCRWEYPRSDLRHFDAIEVWNGGWLDTGNGNGEAFALWTSQLMAGHEHPAVAGSDSHSVDGVRRGPACPTRGYMRMPSARRDHRRAQAWAGISVQWSDGCLRRAKLRGQPGNRCPGTGCRRRVRVARRRRRAGRAANLWLSPMVGRAA